MTLRVVLLSLALISSAAAQSSDLKSAAARITPATVRSHIEFLSDDLMEGRAPGTRGGELAAKYIAARLEALGLEPAGANGTYFQPVPFREFTVNPEKCSATLTVDGKAQLLKWGTDYVPSGNPFVTVSDVDAPIVFVGYGAVVPRRKIDDYAGVDARNKIVAVLRGGSPALPPEERAHYSTGQLLAETAAQHGAIGILLLPTPESEKESPFTRTVSFADQPSLRWIGPEGKPNGTEQIKANAVLAPAMVEKIFAGRPVNLTQTLEALKEGKSQSFETPLRLALHIETTHRQLTSPNVVAVRRGSDPALKSEYLVYSAHYDHLGIGKPVNGDSIYNGAWDNATGVTSLLNIADAFSALQKPPARSVAFVFVTGEEKGLLGSDYFAQYPTLPKQSMIANINIDMIGYFAPYKEVALNPDRTGTAPLIQRVAKMLNLPAVPPAKDAPQRGGGGAFMTRSDGYSFIRQGIPVVGISLRADPKETEKFRDMYGKRYHQPSDDMTMPFNWDSGALFARANFLFGYEIANGKTRPGWKSDDWLALTFHPTTQTTGVGGK